MSWQFAAWMMLGGSTLLLLAGLPVAFTTEMVIALRSSVHAAATSRSTAGCSISIGIVPN